jgi:hypothetical protein
MDRNFINILQKLVDEQTSAALTDAKKCKAFLADYTKGEYKKESRLILLAVEAGMSKTLEGADDLAACKRAFIRDLEEEGLSSTVAADIVNTIALVLRGDKTVTQSATVAPHAPQTGGSESAAELFKKAYTADNAGNHGESVRYIQKVAAVIGSDPYDLPGLIEAFYQKGRELHRAGKLEDAVIFYKGAAFFGHKDAITWLASLNRL